VFCSLPAAHVSSRSTRATARFSHTRLSISDSKLPPFWGNAKYSERDANFKWRRATGGWWLVIGGWLVRTGRRSAPAFLIHQPPATNHQPPITSHQSPLLLVLALVDLVLV
jgi:hypothetical protein